MRPVFLLYAGVVVLVVGARPGEIDPVWLIREIPLQVVVEELAAIIDGETEQWKWKLCFHVPHLFHHTGGPLVPNGPVLRPTAEYIGKREAPYEIPGQRCGTVGHAIGLHKAGFVRHGAGLYRNDVLEQCTGLGAA